MAIQIDATQPRILPGGGTARQALEAFVNLRFDGIDDLRRKLEDAAAKCLKDPGRFLQKAAKDGLRPVQAAYRSSVTSVTGNLRRSFRIRDGKKKYEGIYIAVGGPTHVVEGKEWDVEEKGAGNHAWLVEFGTGRRKPGSQNRRTYVNVHQAINGRFGRKARVPGTSTNEQFERLGRGYYFLMGSKAKGFVKTAGGSRPFVLAPGETYGEMKPQHLMERAINDSRQAVLSAVRASLAKFIDDLSR